MQPVPDHIAWNTWRGVPTDDVRFFQELHEDRVGDMSAGELRHHRLRARCLELRAAHPELPIMHRAREGDGSLK